MRTIQLNNRTLNNYAAEPKMYLADSPAVYEQRRYLQQGALAALLITGLLLVSTIVS